MCRRSLDSTLHCDGPDREIYCRGIFHNLKKSAIPFMAPPVLNSFSICCTDIRTDNPVFWKRLSLKRLSFPERIYLSVYILCLFLLWLVHSCCCYLLKNQFTNSFRAARKQPPNVQGLQSITEEGIVIIDCSIIPFPHLLCRRANSCLFVPNLDC